MARLKTDTLKPGMILAEDLKHSNGRFLLAKGVKLEVSHLRVFKIWGIEKVEIQDSSGGDPEETVEKIDPVVLQRAEKLTRKKFSPANLDHPFLQEIFPICTLRLARQMVQKPGGGPSGKETQEETPSRSEGATLSLPSEKQKNPEILVGDDIRLASLPNIFFEISKVISDPRSSAIHIADVISKDPGLSAKLLKIVNSAFYSFPSRIDTISRAVMIVGSKQLSALALGTSVISIFQDIPSDLVDMKSFWEHSLSCGIAARILASYKNIPNTERLFVAGLLHDIGRLILYKHLPYEEREIFLRTTQTNCLLHSAERDILGFDHAVIGGILLRRWKLPLILEHAVEYHHNPLGSHHPLEASIVYLADILTNALGLGTSGERFVPPVAPDVWNNLDLPTEIFPKVIQLIDRQVEEVIQKFFDGA
jgi:HD-like signal output (HDOD) protein